VSGVVPRGFVYIVLMLMGVVGVLIEGVMVVVLSDCADVVVGRMKRSVARILRKYFLFIVFILGEKISLSRKKHRKN